MKDTTFLGEYSHNIDSQRRLAIPRSWRGENAIFFLIPSRQHCLQIIPEGIFEDFKAKIRKVSFTDPAVSRALAKIGSMAQECHCDKQGRISISANLKDYAKITQEVMLVGAITTGQIWAKEHWDSNLEYSESFFDVVDKLFVDNDNILENLKNLGDSK